MAAIWGFQLLEVEEGRANTCEGSGIADMRLGI